MINFNALTKETFLNDYWQKKPLLIKNALPSFNAFIDESELAGLAMEEDVESKMVFEKPHQTPAWTVKQGPFSEEDFSHLPKTHWTLLVQGVDRFIPEINQLLTHFDFLPQWRVDDIMVSIAGMHGGVGPHYDNYDVFLYQAAGQRKWSLTTKNCHEKNAINDLDLRIMADFEVEETFILEEGDMLYLPPHVGHHGTSLTDNSIGYSFGYRSYQSQELWDSFADYLSESTSNKQYYKDPNWNALKTTSEIPKSAFLNAKERMQALLNDDKKLQHWFSRFATQLDQQAVQLLNEPLTQEESGNLTAFMSALTESTLIERDINLRIAYHFDETSTLCLFINGEQINTHNAEQALIILIACERIVSTESLLPFLGKSNNQFFLYALWQQQFIVF